MNTRRRFSERLLLVVNLVSVNAVAALWIVAFLQPDVLGAGRDLPRGERALVVPLQTVSAWLGLLAGVGLLLQRSFWHTKQRRLFPTARSQSKVKKTRPPGPAAI